MFLHHLVEMGGFALNHHWHGINVLSLLECALLAALLCSMLTLLAAFVWRRKRIAILSAIGAVSFATAAYAANTALSALSAAGAISGTDLFYVVQTVGVGGLKATASQLKTFVNTSAVDARTTTTEAIANSDQNKLVTFSNAGAVAASIAQAGTGGNFAAGWAVSLKNQGAGTVTLTATTSTIDGNATLVLTTGQGVDLYTDGTNYFTQPGKGGVGTVTTTGSPASGNLAKFSGASSVTNGDLSGDCTTSGTLSATCLKTNGISFGTAATQNTGTSGANLPFLNGTNTFSGAQTFGEVIGTVTSQSGTTYTFAATDCGTTVRFTNASAVTATIPQALPVGCSIAVEQAAAGHVAVNGSAVTPATLHSAHSYTKTSAQWAIIGIFTESSNVAILTGDGA